ncbi:MAG: HD domain-containing phosphohydrolase [Desulfopila sp.]
MAQQQKTTSFFVEQINTLFYQRTLLCIWLAVVFFPLFSVLDYVYCREFFSRFLIYRLAYVVVLLSFINILKQEQFKRFAPLLLYVGMLLGVLVLSVMTVHLGGFSSGYYVGILLIIIGTLAALPVTAINAILYGSSMYGLYMITVLLGRGIPDQIQTDYALGNTFFFLTAIGIAAIQCYDDLGTFHKQLRAMDNIQKSRAKLVTDTDRLEETIQQRLDELQESKLKYQDLYDNIMDMVVLVDREGFIHQFNSNCAATFNLDKDNIAAKNIKDLLGNGRDQSDWFGEIAEQLSRDIPVQGLQVNHIDGSARPLEIELNASKLEMEHTMYFQLVLRDISETKSIERNLIEEEERLAKSRQATIFGLARLAECRDDDTGQHLFHMRGYTRILTEELARSPEYGPEISEQFIEEIGLSSVLHDIGKVGIPDAILLKPGKLTRDEFAQMKRHTIFGANILEVANQFQESSSFLQLGQQIARSHHERWDGEGYPDGLQATQIPLAARIIALADVYDALTSKRVYKMPFSHEESRAIIISESGGQFDPHVVNAFLRRENDFKETRIQQLLGTRHGEGTTWEAA